MDRDILITGANGQLGRALSAKYPLAKKITKNELDISDCQAVDSYNWDGIKLIINAAAFTKVDAAETEEGRTAAWAVNAVGPANLARVALKHDITLIHISSDYVFDGKCNHHLETESYNPLSVYGSSKAAGDIAVSVMKKHYILRTSWVVGDGGNFVRTMLAVGKKGISPTVVSDQRGRLTFTIELVRAIEYLLVNKSPYGIYNVTNSGVVVSWADITRAIFAEAGFNLDVHDITTENYFADKPHTAIRPLNSALDLSKLNTAGFKARNWQENLKEYVAEEMKK